MREINKAKEPELKRMNLNVPIELHNAFKSTTAARGQNMTDVLLEFIRDYVVKNSPLKPKGRRR
ncbi:MAG TPA: plasmid partition protein ParG [Candidatus Baltobacteraceae bacterium]|nr:plasmid partition protein ParG [Candidatus Baltobacteraceae bacterium]